MRKKYSAVFTVLILSLALACGAYAGNGAGVGDCTGPLNDGTQQSGNNSAINGNGAGDGTGPIHEIVDGGDFIVEGTIAFIGEPGAGMILEDGTVVYGLAPYWYWESLGVDKPTIGDYVTVEGYTVIIDGVERYVATSVTIGDDTVQLRDPDTLKPLWRAPMMGQAE